MKVKKFDQIALNKSTPNFFTFIDHKSKITQIDNFEFHFFITYL